MPFYTVGHSNHPLERFIDLIASVGIRCIADVRRYPRSRTNPHFNVDRLPRSLGLVGVGYVHLAALGGRRSTTLAEGSPNGYWQQPSFRAYADYALTPGFADGLASLRALGHTATTAIMCSEAVWWRCHRRIITDYLLLSEEAVLHLMAKDKAIPAEMTPGAQRRGTTLVYPGLH